MKRKEWLLMVALGMSAGLLSAQGVAAGDTAFIASDTVELTHRDASSPGQMTLPNRVNISDLEILDEKNQTVISLQRGMRYKFWLWFDVPICAPYMNRIVSFKGTSKVFEHVWVNEQSYCGIYGVALGVAIANDAELGKYRWGGQTITFNGSDLAFPATYQVIEIAP